MDNDEEPLAGHAKYEKITDLGRGTFGFVQLARNRQTGEEVAIKFLPRGKQHVTRYVGREILAHSSLCHPHVVVLKGVILTPAHLGIVLEYVPGGDLYQYVRSRGALSENEARVFFQQLVVALDYCHKVGIVNRDIKLENTLIDNTTKLVKITDFGYAKRTNQDSMPISNVGTQNYAAPEVISHAREPYDGRQADVWSLGVMLYVMLFYSYPFERKGDPKGRRGEALVLDRTIRVDYRFPAESAVSASCKDLLARILVADPVQRLSIEQIYEHPWFKKGFPKQASSMNEDCLALRPPPEVAALVENEIKELVNMATALPGEVVTQEENNLFRSDSDTSFGML